ncbi:hypothetical protein RF11_03728 [Thelohanellus kitauei]|uniref:Uncharacterized protein n=1 Tax=Thelohanellus kitauei TaxID=669202 RepID=A0A0C2NAF5_THEKT|nr:hypothetical protein RF11_03728 [Thelohanellus kitauei]
MKTDVSTLISEYHSCLVNKPKNPRPKSNLEPFNKSIKHDRQLWDVDFMNLLPRTINENKYIFVLNLTRRIMIYERQRRSINQAIKFQQTPTENKQDTQYVYRSSSRLTEQTHSIKFRKAQSDTHDHFYQTHEDFLSLRVEGRWYIM